MSSNISQIVAKYGKRQCVSRILSAALHGKEEYYCCQNEYGDCEYCDCLFDDAVRAHLSKLPKQEIAELVRPKRRPVSPPNCAPTEEMLHNHTVDIAFAVWLAEKYQKTFDRPNERAEHAASARRHLVKMLNTYTFNQAFSQHCMSALMAYDSHDMAGFVKLSFELAQFRRKR